MGFVFYHPNGHLEEAVTELFSPFKVNKPGRGGIAKSDYKEATIKFVRPQDTLKYCTHEGIGVSGMDMLEDRLIQNPEWLSKILVLDILSIRPTKLYLAISEERFPGVSSMDGLVNELKPSKDNPIRANSEYIGILGKFLPEKYPNIPFDYYRPEGSTETSILPPDPNADIIGETSETGKSLEANKLQVIDTIMGNVDHLLIANRKTYEDNKEDIDKLRELFRAKLYAKRHVKLEGNILNVKDVEEIEKYLINRGFTPTMSSITSKNGKGKDVVINALKTEALDIAADLENLGASTVNIIKLVASLYYRDSKEIEEDEQKVEEYMGYLAKLIK